jgi:mono/diheme cytochrome c family protein
MTHSPALRGRCVGCLASRWASTVSSLVFVMVTGVGTAWAAEPFTVAVQLGPISGTPSASRTVTFEKDARRQVRTYDVQDAREHNVRGISLPDLVAHAKAPKAVDAAVFVYTDGMQIPVHLADKDEVDAIFIALEHGDVRDRFAATYPLQNKAPLSCPKVVYGRRVTAYSIWHYPTELAVVKLVTWKLYEAALAQPTRQFPDRSGWPLYEKHCQSCHGIGHQGATRGPDFLGDMDAYRRVPPLAVTDLSEHPSLHEKVKGFTEGTMPVLTDISNAEIAALWRWLHAIHRQAIK